MLNIILTIDYEIFGDGAGDVIKHIIKPTSKILEICDRHKVPLTIMFEVNEYQKFLKYESELSKNLGYSPAQEMKKQVLDAYSKGHDIQLHIHPQWVDAEYKNLKWIMKDPERSITDFPKTKINAIIQEGKKRIENIVQAMNKDYAVQCMRLTNLPWIEAPVQVHDAMIQNQIYFHSLATSDSLKNNKQGFWYIDPAQTIFEIPIHSLTKSGYKKFTWNRIKTAFYRKLYTKSAISPDPSLRSQGLFFKLKNLIFDPQSIKWDFCKQNNREMIKFLDEAIERYDHLKEDVPLVMIAHSKDFFNGRNFDLFLNEVKKKYYNNETIFTTMSKFCSSITNK